MTTIEKLLDAAQKYDTVRRKVLKVISTINPVEMVTPLNFTEAKNDWISKAESGFFENPNFIYDPVLLNNIIKKADAIERMKEKIAEITPLNEYEGFLRRHYSRALGDALKSVDMAKAILAQNDGVLRKQAISKYGKPVAIKYAADMVKREFKYSYSGEEPAFPKEQIQILNNITLDANFIREIFLWSMKQYEIEPWPVTILKDCTAIDVRDKNSSGRPIIAIPASRKMNGTKLAELVGHEIECHWRNSINDMFIGCLKTDDEVVYEGVAKIKDMAFQAKITGAFALPSPYYILAEDMALNGLSFAKVGRVIFDKTNDLRKAWIFTYRTFRGIADTNNVARYAFTKDRVYLDGMIYVQELNRAGLSNYLNFGALSIADLKELIDLIDKESIMKFALKDRHIQNNVPVEIISRL